MKRNLALCAMVSCALFAAACGSRRQRGRRATDEPAATATAEAETGDQHGRAVRVLRPGGLRPQLAQRTSSPRGPRQAVGAGDRARDGRHDRVQGQEGERLEPVLLQRRGRQPVAPGRLDDDAGGGQAPRRDRQLPRGRRRGEGRQADLRHRGARGRQLRRADRLAEHHRDAHAGRRGGVREGAGHRVRPRRQHRLPGHVRAPDRRLRVRRRRRRVPERERRLRRQDPGAPHPPGRRRARDPLVGRQGRSSTSPTSNVVGVEFTDGDAAKTKSIVSDYLQREGQIDGVWMDAGATAVAAMEAFEDNGQEIPPFVGEDQTDFLTKWQEDGLTAIAPTYSNYQWRTAVIAAVKILKGEEVPKEWVLPQPTITAGHAGPSTSIRTCRRCTTRCAAARRCPATPRRGAADRQMNPLGANAWIWVSPLTDERLADLAPRVRAWGFDVLELPIEQLGDWDPARAAEILAAHGLRPTVCVAMGPGRELCATDAGTVAVDAGLPEGLHRHGGDPRRRLRSPARSTRRSAAPGGCPPRSAQAVLRGAARGPAPGRRVRRRARREDRGRAAHPLRDERDQHRRAGARGDRRAAAGGLRPAGRHLPRQRRGEGLRGRVHAGGRPARARARVGQRPRRAGRRPHRLAGLPRRAAQRRLRRARS